MLDDDHRAVFTQTRRLGEVSGPRYLNCSSKAAPNPRISRYRKAGPARALIVCEGVIDALTAADAGFDAVALLGSAIADDRVADEVARTAGRAIVLALDADDAGESGAARLASLLSEKGRRATRLRPDSGFADLNEWRAGAGDDWARILDERVRDVLAPTDLALHR